MLKYIRIDKYSLALRGKRINKFGDRKVKIIIMGRRFLEFQSVGFF